MVTYTTNGGITMLVSGARIVAHGKTGMVMMSRIMYGELEYMIAFDGCGGLIMWVMARNVTRIK